MVNRLVAREPITTRLPRQQQRIPDIVAISSTDKPASGSPTVSTDPSNHFDDSVKLFFPSNNFTQSPERLHDSSFHPSFFSLFSFHTSTSKQRITLNNSFHQKVCIFIYTFFVSFVSHTFVSFTEKLMVHHVSNSERKKKIVAILFYPFPFFSNARD